MRIVITGSHGQLGSELISGASRRALEVIGLDIQEMDITSADQIDAVLSKYNPHAVINAAAYTQVDAAENDRDRAHAVNATAAGLLADWCRRSGSFLVHISTDYVFNGQKGALYVESDITDPLSVYGATKAQGELLVREHLPQHLIVRTSWLYSRHGQNFVKTIIGLSREREVLRIVSDQYGSPTNAADLAGAILTMITHVNKNPGDAWGTYHYCCKGVASWYEFAAEIVRLMPNPPDGRQISVEPISTEEYPAAARRPVYSGLDCRKFESVFKYRLRKWTEALKPVVDQLTAASS
jgi:dTDP-4-dehydrorhamnose reductase